MVLFIVVVSRNTTIANNEENNSIIFPSNIETRHLEEVYLKRLNFLFIAFLHEAFREKPADGNDKRT